VWERRIWALAGRWCCGSGWSCHGRFSAGHALECPARAAVASGAERDGVVPGIIALRGALCEHETVKCNYSCGDAWSGGEWREATVASEIYSCGCVLALLAGRSPLVSEQFGKQRSVWKLKIPDILKIAAALAGTLASAIDRMRRSGIPRAAAFVCLNWKQMDCSQTGSGRRLVAIELFRVGGCGRAGRICETDSMRPKLGAAAVGCDGCARCCWCARNWPLWLPRLREFDFIKRKQQSGMRLQQI